MILGHQKQIQYLTKIIETKKIPHALLFTGEKNLGKKEVAIEFSSWILGNNPFKHPDFFLIEPLEKQIQIDQIRELINKVSLTPLLSPWKVAIINEAHLMTKEAQNCLLKTLEEPQKAILILVSHLPRTLLPTIISRCQLVKFFPLKKEEIQRILSEKKLKEETINKILEISFGRPKIALSLAENPTKLENYKKIEEMLEILKGKSLFSRFRFIEKTLEEISFVEFLDILSTIFRKNAIIKGEEKYLTILKEIEEIQILNSITNIDQKFALETLFLKI